MRIVSWNMNRLARSQAEHREAWDYLRDELHADLALVQEASPPAEIKSRVYRPIDEDKYNWGSAVVALRSDLVLQPRARVSLADCYLTPVAKGELPDSHQGACAVADIRNAQGQPLFTAISLYGQWEMMPGSQNMFAGPRVHRMLSDLTGIFATSRNRVVIAGDLNVTTQGAKSQENEAAAVFARLRAWRLVDCVASTSGSRPRLANCTCPDGESCSHVQTYRHNRGVDGNPTQFDYAFASESMTLTQCEVVHADAAWSLSDHCPIVLEIEETLLGGVHVRKRPANLRLAVDRHGQP